MERFRAGEVELSVEQRGHGIPLLLVHGFPLDHSMWQSQLDELARDCRVIAPDLRGFGRSQATAGTTTMEQYADDLAVLLDAMNIQDSVICCGLSMGGYVALQFWRRHAGRLRGLILCDTRAAADSVEGASGRHRSAEKVVANGPAELVESMIPKLFAERTRVERNDLIEATRQVMMNTSREGIAAALRGMAARPDMTSELARVTVPALCLCGEHDAITPPAELRDVARAMPAAEFIEISGAGHMAPLEQPAAVNAAILEFVRRIAR